MDNNKIELKVNVKLPSCFGHFGKGNCSRCKWSHSCFVEWNPMAEIMDESKSEDVGTEKIDKFGEIKC